MKLSELIVGRILNEYYNAGDYSKMVSAKDVKAAKKNFIANFKQQVKLNSKAGNKPDVMDRLVYSYLKRYGVSDSAMQNQSFQDLVQQAGNETGFFTPKLNTLLDRMYLLASTTVEPQSGHNPGPHTPQTRNSGAGAFNQMTNQLSTQQAQQVQPSSNYPGSQYGTHQTPAQIRQAKLALAAQRARTQLGRQ